MGLRESSIRGAFEFTPRVLEDSRGYFFESFRASEVKAATGHHFRVAQVNNSSSARGVIRGIHFKEQPPGQAKFVYVSHGSVIDVVMDLRRSSPTFGQWEAFELSSLNRRALLIGYGLGHAFLSLEDGSQVNYLCDSVYEPDKEHAINPLGSGINWTKLAIGADITEFHISDRDRNAPNLQEAAELLFD